jgi:hypothetical protein
MRIADLRDVVDAGGSVTGWAHEAVALPADILVDPERGRVLLGSGRAAEHAAAAFFADFYYGFSRSIGGGEYERTTPGESLAIQRKTGRSEALQPHLDAIRSGGRLVIDDSLTYPETPVFKVDGVTELGKPGREVAVTARNGARPVIAASEPITLDIGARGRLVLDGLVISGGALKLAASGAGDDQPRELVLRHCTLVPGLKLHSDGSAVSTGTPSLTVGNRFATVTLEQCIVGALRIESDAKVKLVDCIVDGGSPEAIAFEGMDPGEAAAEMTIEDSTVVGRLHVRLMRLASNTIFFARPLTSGPWKAPLRVERNQEGCVRFCFVPAGSLAPKRFRCVPDDKHPDVLPHFTSLRYGEPGYAQLRSATDRAIREGADDEGEIGVMHPLYQPQRETNLRIRFDEYLRFGLHAGIFYVT